MCRGKKAFFDGERRDFLKSASSRGNAGRKKTTSSSEINIPREFPKEWESDEFFRNRSTMKHIPNVTNFSP